jgi:hypothetical protein
MKKFLQKTIAVILVAGIAYILFFSVEKIEPGRICVVKDLRSKTIIRVVRPVAGGFAFAWQGALPWWFLVSDMPAQRAAAIKIKIAFPELSFLKGDYYHLWVPLKVAYRINGDTFSDSSKLGNNGRDLDDQVGRFFQDELQREMAPYLAPAYQREVLAAQIESILAKAQKGLEPQCKTLGVEIKSAAVSGNLLLPDKALYNEGLAHAADLRKMERAREMDLIGVRGALERERLKNEQLFADLMKISKIISANPDILKYIYIDKLGGNVNVILSSDSSGVPRMLENSPKPAKGKPREIDNLR